LFSALGLPKIPSLILTPSPSANLLNEQIEEEDEFDAAAAEDDDYDDDAPMSMVAAPRMLAAPQPSSRRRTTSEAVGSSSPPAGLRYRAPGDATHMRKNLSTPGFGRLAKITGLDGPPDLLQGGEHVIYGVSDGSQLFLRPSRRNSQAIVRPMSRKDIFFGGSVLALAQLQERRASAVNETLLLDKYRHSVISIPREQGGGGASASVGPHHPRQPLPRGSVVASHLSIRKDAVDPELRGVRLTVAGSLVRVLKEMIDVSVLKNPLFALCCLSQLIAFLVNGLRTLTAKVITFLP